MIYVGGRNAGSVEQLFSSIARKWTSADGEPVEAAFGRANPHFPDRTRIYLVDKPGAAQSEIRIGHPGVSSLDRDYYGLQILNYTLGGSFSSRINLNLREDKGYTYGARSGFGGGLEVAPFTASSGVRTNVTAESVYEFMKELEGIVGGVTEEELEFSRSAMIQAMNRRYESTRALEGLLEQISKYGYADDFLAQRVQQIDTITLEDLAALAEKYVHPERMMILVVGDKDAVLEKLEALPWGSNITELGVLGEPLSR